jgi:hypothetical protein
MQMQLTCCVFVCAGYECPTGTHGFYDAPASYADWLEEIGIESRESLLILRVATPVSLAACGPSQQPHTEAERMKFWQLPLPTLVPSTHRATAGLSLRPTPTCKPFDSNVDEGCWMPLHMKDVGCRCAGCAAALGRLHQDKD